MVVQLLGAFEANRHPMAACDNLAREEDCREWYNVFMNIPIVKPTIFDEPWLIAFTTLVDPESETASGKVLSRSNFKASVGEANRRRLDAALLPLQTTWLTLKHGTNIVNVPSSSNHNGDNTENEFIFADAAIVTNLGHAAALTTADCLPIIIVEPVHHGAALIHAGWRSLADGIIELTIRQMLEEFENTAPYKDLSVSARINSPTSENSLKAWIGPSIGSDDYEVGSEVREAFLKSPFPANEIHFKPSGNIADKYLADLRGIAVSKLMALGIDRSKIEIYPGSTLSEPNLYSVRRDGQETGRMATVVGIKL